MHYYVKDHLGSNRLVVDGNGNIEETNHYYPFGALMGDSKNTKKNRFKYVGNELDRMYGVDMQDHGARWYDPVVGRWNVKDSKCEKYLMFSAYQYSYNNTLRYEDTNGKEIFISNDAQRAIILSWVNQLSNIQFAEENGTLYSTDIILNENRSFFYSQMLMKAVSDKDCYIFIDISDVYQDPQTGIPCNIEYIGGGVTIPKMEGVAEIYISDKDWNLLEPLNPNESLDDGFIIDTPAYKLMHELVGHAIPFIKGYASTNIPAAINENKCRKEIGVPLRKIYNNDSQLKLRQ